MHADLSLWPSRSGHSPTGLVVGGTTGLLRSPHGGVADRGRRQTQGPAGLVGSRGHRGRLADKLPASVSREPEAEDSAVSQFGVVVYLGALLASIVYVLMLGPKAAWPTSVAYVAPPTQVRPDSNAAAVASVEAARRKREEARGLAQRDPQMARELRIGRPDLPETR